MALNAQSLARIGSVPYSAGEAKSLFLYATDDTFANITGANYFNGATKTLKKGDVIMCTCSLSAAPTVTAVVVTSASGAAAVTVAVEKLA
jgi:hypothetical protein